MKKVRIVFASLAFAVALVGAFASIASSNDATVLGAFYQGIERVGGEDVNKCLAGTVDSHCTSTTGTVNQRCTVSQTTATPNAFQAQQSQTVCVTPIYRLDINP
jgi:hypothetical protein